MKFPMLWLATATVCVCSVVFLILSAVGWKIAFWVLAFYSTTLKQSGLSFGRCPTLCHVEKVWHPARLEQISKGERREIKGFGNLILVCCLLVAPC